MSDGWIKLHRSLLEWEWWTDNNVKILWFTILLLANHRQRKWQGRTVEAGQFITSIQSLADKSGLSFQAVRTALDKLQSTGEINIQSTNKNTLITVIKWADFQCDEELQQTNNKQTTNKQQSNNKRTTTNKNDKNVKNERNINTIPPTLEEVTQYCNERHNNVDPQTFMDFYESKGWMVGKNKMKDWKACVRTWEKGRSGKGHVVIEPPDYIKPPVNWDEEELPF